MRSNKEYQMCKAVSIYMKLKYKNVIFHFDLAGLNLSRAQAGMTKAIQGDRGFPDFFIAHPNKFYKGLFLEFKTTTPFLKDGITLKSDKHIMEQSEFHFRLLNRGYCAQFVVGFLEAQKEIDNYLK